VGQEERQGLSRRFAVVGSPITHSLSPLLHETAYAALGVTDASYTRYEVGAGELEQFLSDGPGAMLDGLSVTMPGKPEAFAVSVQADATSRLLGVSNTLIRRPEGGFRAENHDVHGIVAALRDHGVQRPGSVGILGSGATAQCAVEAASRLGARSLLLSARSPEKVSALSAFAERRGLQVETIDFSRCEEVLAADVAISALAAAGARAVARDWAERGGPAAIAPSRTAPVVLDALYDPWPAPIAAACAEIGAEVASGLEMLVHQADMQLRSMLGIDAAPTRLMLEAARRSLDRQDAQA
jgi:shikimate dehydrogenase